VNTLFPVIRQAFGLGVDALGILSSISKFARMLFGPAWSLAADRFGRKRILFIITGVWGVWTIAAGFAQNFTQLLILYSIGVLGTVAGEPITNGLLADMFKENERGKAFGAIRSIASAGSLVLTPLIGQLADVQNGWRLGLIIMGGLSMISGVLILIFVVEPDRQPALHLEKPAGLKWKDISILIKTPSFLLLAGMLPFVTSLVLFSFFVTYFVDVRGWRNSEAAILYAIFMGGWTLSSLAGGFIGDWFDRRMGPNGRVALMQAYLAAFSLLSYCFLQIDWGHGLPTYGFSFLFGLVGSVGFSGAVLPMVCAIVPSRLSATAFSLLFSLVQGFLSAILTLAFGKIAMRIGLQATMLWMVTIPYAINAVYWLLFYRFYPADCRRIAASPDLKSK
jgi:MFS family permease